jgi:hypothetical protein
LFQRGYGFQGYEMGQDRRGNGKAKWTRGDDGSPFFGIVKCGWKIREFSKRTFSNKISYFYLFYQINK